MDCKSCKEQKNEEQVSYIAFESMKATLERTVKRLWILAIILVLLLFVSNAGWIYYESQWEDERSTEITQDVDTETGDAVFAGIGDAYYGKNPSDS